MNNGKAIGTLGGAVAMVIAAVFAVEGGFVDNPKDPGGATNHGVTEKVARQHGYTGSMQAMPKSFAEQIYRHDYIEKPNFHRVIAMSPALGEKLVDVGVNAGPSRSAKWFQESLNQLSRNGADYPRVAVDGRIGNATLAAYQSLERKRGRVKACEMTMKLMDTQQGTHYMRLNMPTFMVGWVDNRIGNVPLSRCQERVEGVSWNG